MNRDSKSTAIRCELGHRIKTLRIAENLTQQELGLMVGLDRTYLVGIERGTRNITIDTLVKIASGLGVTLSSLLEDVEETPHINYAYVPISRN